VIHIKRAYEQPSRDDGVRILVDRLWPRGVGKDRLLIDAWYKEIAPSSQLRAWFRHDPDKWDEFRKRYFAELDSAPELWRPLLEIARSRNITLVYGAKDRENNNAVSLKEYLESKLSQSP